MTQRDGDLVGAGDIALGEADIGTGTEEAETVGERGYVVARNGHGEEREPLSRTSLALVGSADVAHLLLDSDKRTLAILELRRRAAAAKRRGSFVARRLLLADALGLVLAFAVADALVGSASNRGRIPALGELAIFAATLPLWTIAAKIYGLYDNDDERTDHTTADDLVGVFHLVTVGTWGLFVASHVAGVAQPHIWRLIVFWALATALIALTRCLARVYCRRQIAYLQNVIIVGAGEVGQSIARKLLRHSEYGVNLLGFVDDESTSMDAELESVRVLGQPQDLPTLVRVFDVERVIFAFSREPEPSMRELVQAMKEHDVQVDIVPRLFEAVGPNASMHTVEGLPLMSLPPVRPSRSSLAVKRLLDIAGASIGLLLLAPLFAVVAIAIKLDSKGPILYRSERLGRNGDKLSLFKFRTMELRCCSGDRYGGAAAEEEFRRLLADADRQREFDLTVKLRHDPRVTRVGAWLRRTSLDELPQLLNVLLGGLSLVGPRPLLRHEFSRYGSAASAVLAVKPGITGYWQINGRSGLDYEDRIRLQLAYVDSWSLKLDCKIIANTLRAVVSRRGAF